MSDQPKRCSTLDELRERFGDDVRRRFGTYLREHREAAGRTQEEIAALIPVKQPTLSGWENGQTFPAIPSIYRLAAVLDLDVAEVEVFVSEYLGRPAASAS